MNTGHEVMIFLIDLLALKKTLGKWAFLWYEPIQSQKQDDIPQAQSTDPVCQEQLQTQLFRENTE